MTTDDAPEDVFATAQTAIRVGDMPGAFACFGRDDLLKIAGNSVRALSTSDPEFDAACRSADFDEDALRQIRQLTTAMAVSATSLTEDPSSFDGEAHHQMVKDYDTAIKTGLRSVVDLPDFAAALEQRMHAVMGGGSISTTQFADESLVDVEIDGKRAWATRVRGGGETEDIGFSRKRDGWKLRLFVRRPQR